MLETVRVVHPFGAASRDDLRAALFLTALVAVDVSDMLARAAVYAWYWHVAGIAYAGVAGVFVVRRSRARD